MHVVADVVLVLALNLDVNVIWIYIKMKQTDNCYLGLNQATNFWQLQQYTKIYTFDTFPVKISTVNFFRERYIYLKIKLHMKTFQRIFSLDYFPYPFFFLYHKYIKTMLVSFTILMGKKMQMG